MPTISPARKLSEKSLSSAPLIPVTVSTGSPAPSRLAVVVSATSRPAISVTIAS